MIRSSALEIPTERRDEISVNVLFTRGGYRWLAKSYLFGSELVCLARILPGKEGMLHVYTKKQT